ncbi:MAG: hypothetical protein IKO32_09430 [Lachnospiraceae bacterium]|nr:hypothetical protein [Lachnospiraceae bacterium]
MKKNVKQTLVISVLVLTLLTLVGCAGLEKKKAFMDYQSALAQDTELFETAADDLDKVQSAINQRDMTTTKAILQSKIIPTLNKLSTNATTRHNSITDTELANIDSHYVNYANYISDAFVLMLDAINTEDQNKMNKATAEMNSAMNELTEYANGMQKYMNDYGIKDDGSLEEVKAMLGN